MFNIVLVYPEIPHNTGAIGRLALATGSVLHLVEPLGFSLDEKAVRRSGLDYWRDVQLRRWPSWEAFLEGQEELKNLWFFTTKVSRPYWKADFRAGDYLIFGAETKGLPPEILASDSDRCLTIPMPGGTTRSLNLATAAGIALYEGVRQLSIELS